MKYAIGLDIGVSSVGFAAVGLGIDEKPIGIIKIGTRIFPEAENPKDGASLALPRREARSMRRRLRRKRHRKERIRNLLLSQQLVTQNELDTLYQNKQLEDIYALRTRALDELITNTEFARILIHLAQRRGFQSNRKSDTVEKEAGKLLSAVKENADRMQKANYRTIGEMFYKDASFVLNKRNKGENYLATVQRSMVKDEVELLFAAQRRFAAKFATPMLQEEYLNILMAQRSFDEGPGGNSPYGGNQIEKMVGKCTFLPLLPRAAKATYSFERFQLLQKINHMHINRGGQTRMLTNEERSIIISFAHKTAEISYARIRKELNLADEETFNDVRPGRNATMEEAEKKAKLNCLKSYHAIRLVLNKVTANRIEAVSQKQLNVIGTALTMYKNDKQVRAALEETALTAMDIDALLMLPGFRGFGHLSVEACDAITPYLEAGLTYDKACEQAGFEFKGHNQGSKQLYLPATAQEMERITSPVVRRAVSQTIKVVNAIIREMKESPVYVNVELAREMSKDFNERRQLENEMKENAAGNERLMKRIREEFHVGNASGQDLVKLKLYEEQGGICAYSLQPIHIEQLFEPGYVEVDHIIPYSISFDDTYNNKVLVFANENRQKGNRLPLQYLQGKRHEDFIVWTSTAVRNHRKKQILLKENITEEDIDKFKERNLQDTKFMAAFLYNYINDYLLFAPSGTGRKRRVTAVNGAVTSHLRKRWGLSKVRANGDTHHAVDALVIACATSQMINEISSYYQYIESEYMQDEAGEYSYHSKTARKFPAPWPHFRDEITLRLGNINDEESLLRINPYFYSNYDVTAVKPVFVSRMPNRKVTGPAHKDTIKGVPANTTGIVTVKRPLTMLKQNDEGEIKDYYMPSSDLLLYNALKARLSAFGGNAEKAFAEPFYKPKSDGSQGPLVKKVKLYEKSTLAVPVHSGNGIADNGSMVRIDVFHVENDGYYFVPIYVSDTVKSVLPNKGCIAFKAYEDWKEMKDEDFIFSLYPRDLVKITAKKPIVFKLKNAKSTLEKEYSKISEYAYFVSAGIAVATISIVNHDNTYGVDSLGIKTLKGFEKCQVDMLGNITMVKKEVRQLFKKRR